MSQQINSAIELSNEELDLVAGGAIIGQETILTHQYPLFSIFNHSPFGAVFGANPINNPRLT